MLASRGARVDNVVTVARAWRFTRGGSHAEGRPRGSPGDDPALAPEGAGDLRQDARVGPRGVWRRRGTSSSQRVLVAQALVQKGRRPLGTKSKTGAVRHADQGRQKHETEDRRRRRRR